MPEDKDDNAIVNPYKIILIVSHVGEDGKEIYDEMWKTDIKMKPETIGGSIGQMKYCLEAICNEINKPQKVNMSGAIRQG